MISAGLPGDTLFGEIVISANNLSLLGGGWSIRLHQGNAGYADVIATIMADDVIRTKTRVKYQGAWMQWQNLSDDTSISQATKGFGLGNAVGYSLLDANTAVYGGFYYWGPTALNVPFPYGAMIVIPRSATSSNKPSLTQIASQETSGKLNPHAILAVRKASDNGDGSWGEWDYINPPMQLGVEYRTTERYLDKPVYAKLIDCGTIPAQGTYKTLAFSSDEPKVIVSVIAYSGMRGTTLPYYDTNGTRYSIAGNGNSIVIWNYSEPSLDTDVYALVKYTKKTN